MLLRIGSFLFLIFHAYQGYGNSWTHPFANPEGRNSLALPLNQVEILPQFQFNTITLPFSIHSLLSADINGDGFDEVIGVSEDQHHLLSIDFNRKSQEIIFSGTNIELRALIDIDDDRSYDILFSEKIDAVFHHKAWSQSKNSFLFDFMSHEDSEDEFIYTVSDFNLDETKELLVVQNTPDRSTLYLYNTDSGDELINVRLPGRINRNQIVLGNHREDIRSTIFIATKPGSTLLQNTFNLDSSIPHISAIDFDESLTPELMWDHSIRLNQDVIRMAYGTNIIDFSVLMVATITKESAQPSSGIFSIDSETGEGLNQYTFENTNLINFSMNQFDDDVEDEILLYDDLENMTRIDFSSQRIRVNALISGRELVGGSEFFSTPFNELVGIQTINDRIALFFFDYDLNPLGIPSPFNWRGNVVSSPIICDTNNDQVAEVIFVSSGDVNEIIQVGYQKRNIVPTPTPIPSVIEAWEKY